MSFSELALEESAYVEWKIDDSRGRRLLAASVSRMDESWSSVRMTTLSVACVVVAAAYDRDLARRLVMSMLGMMSKMCDFWSHNVGGGVQDLPDQKELLAESKETDVLGQELSKKANPLLGALLFTVLLDLPKTWSTHFRLASEVVHSFGVVLDNQDLSWASRQMVDEQHKMMAGLLVEAQEVLEDDSSKMVAALEWAGKARDLYGAVQQVEPNTALAAIIGKIGFPNAEV